MSKCKKYVTGGSINPFWIAEQQEKNNDCDVSVSININIGNDHDNYLEGMFQFLKRHKNDTPDDLELAIKVVKSSLNNKK